LRQKGGQIVDKGQIAAARAHGGQAFGRFHFFQNHVQMGVPFLRTLDGRGQQPAANRGEHGHPQRARHGPTHGRHVRLGLVQHGEQPIGVRHQQLACRRQTHASALAFDELNADFLLELGNLLRHGRGRQEQRFGHRRHRRAVGEFPEGA